MQTSPKMSKHLFPYEWTLASASFAKNKGDVFSTFGAGGGSTMGYKLSGYNVLGSNDIDKRMMDCYIANHKPELSFIEPMQTFSKRKDLPKKLYNLAILDGSPPCSSFSRVGNREKDWGKAKKFKEGQAEQILDELFFDQIELTKELQPLVAVNENVKGILEGAAKSYVIDIYNEYDKAGYYLQHFLFNSSVMGVPQKRERVFFIALRKDVAGQFLYQKDMFTLAPKIDLSFNEPLIPFGIVKDHSGVIDRPIPPGIKKYYDLRAPGETCMGETLERVENRRSYFSQMYQKDTEVAYTITANSADGSIVDNCPRWLNNSEILKIGSFPSDYNFLNMDPKYLVGMSVPPLMTAHISKQIYDQWLSKIPT